MFANALAKALKTVFSLAPILRFLVRYQTMYFASIGVAFWISLMMIEVLMFVESFPLVFEIFIRLSNT